MSYEIYLEIPSIKWNYFISIYEIKFCDEKSRVKEKIT